MRCDLLASRTQNGYVIRVQGKGTSSVSPSIVDFVRGCFEQEPESVVTIDLLGCEYLDSTFLGSLLKLQRKATPGRFFVVADRVACERLLTATCLDQFLELLDEAPPSTGTFLRIEPADVSKQTLGHHMKETHEVLAELPSPAAAAFKRIAEQLANDLAQEDRGAPGMFDTAIVTPPPRK